MVKIKMHEPVSLPTLQLLFCSCASKYCRVLWELIGLRLGFRRRGIENPRNCLHLGQTWKREEWSVVKVDYIEEKLETEKNRAFWKLITIRRRLKP